MRRSPALVAVLLLTACAAGPVPSEDAHGQHGGDGAGSPHPSLRADADGVIEIEDEFAFGGEGVTVAEALDVASSTPVLITGTLLRDAAGDIWICDTLAESDPPACGSPRAVLEGWPEDATVFDPENAASTGAVTDGDVTWIPDQQVFGVAHPAP